MTLERHGFLAERLATANDREALLCDPRSRSLLEHVEVVPDDRVLDLVGGIDAPIADGDVLTFIPAHACGA